MPIRVDNLSKRNGNQWLYRDVSFEVADGEVFAIFGPSRSGKRELLNEISNNSVFGGSQVSLITRIFRAETVAAAMLFDRLIKHESSGPLFLDTPFKGLDADERFKLAESFKSRKEPVIFSTNSFDDVLFAVARCPGAQRGRVGAGAGLGKAVAAQRFHGGKLRYPLGASR